MTRPDAKTLFDVLDRTWPAAGSTQVGGFLIRDGRGGGKRVSAAVAVTSEPDISAAETAMTQAGQTPLFMIRDGNESLDQDLAGCGYARIDPTRLYAAPVRDLIGPVPPVTAFTIWEPLEIMTEIWTQGGIDLARIDVMHRADLTKTGLFGRVNNRPAGAGFVACSGQTAMVHALEVRPDSRRLGLARHIMIAAANWAEGNGADHLAVAVLRDNLAANALYSSLGMDVVGHYHYRIKPN